MSNQRPLAPAVSDLVVFRHSAGMPCPYLVEGTERQLYTELPRAGGGNVRELFERLSLAGFRRSHHIVYRPACPGCRACVPVRIPVEHFRYGRAWRRVARINGDLVARDAGLTITDEQYGLFRSYVLSRHNDGDMALMTRRDFASMVVTSPVATSLIEFRADSGDLVAGCLVDRLSDGVSAVYSFFDPDMQRRSLGSYMVLWLVEEARRRGLAYVYLGFWIAGSSKMAYKSRFRPLEGFGPDGWVRLFD